MTKQFSSFELDSKILKTRHEIRETIHNSAERMSVISDEIADLRVDLKAAQADPNLDKIMLRMLESSIRNMEKDLADLRAGYEAFVKRMALPNAAFPFGITAEATK